MRMADNRTIEQRSQNMKRIRAKDTKPELLVRRFLHAKGFRFRLYNKNIIGKPDLTLKKHNTLIFINGCFWHGHKNCKYAKKPTSNTEFWKAKISKNIIRDQRNIRLLRKDGWMVLIIWECQLVKKKSDLTLSKLDKNIMKR